jgi:hypothetical protein
MLGAEVGVPLWAAGLAFTLFICSKSLGGGDAPPPRKPENREHADNPPVGPETPDRKEIERLVSREGTRGTLDLIRFGTGFQNLMTLHGAAYTSFVFRPDMISTLMSLREIVKEQGADYAETSVGALLAQILSHNAANDAGSWAEASDSERSVTPSEISSDSGSGSDPSASETEDEHVGSDADSEGGSRVTATRVSGSESDDTVSLTEESSSGSESSDADSLTEDSSSGSESDADALTEDSSSGSESDTDALTENSSSGSEHDASLSDGRGSLSSGLNPLDLAAVRDEPAITVHGDRSLSRGAVEPNDNSSQESVLDELNGAALSAIGLHLVQMFHAS